MLVRNGTGEAPHVVQHPRRRPPVRERIVDPRNGYRVKRLRGAQLFEVEGRLAFDEFRRAIDEAGPRLDQGDSASDAGCPRTHLPGFLARQDVVDPGGTDDESFHDLFASR